MTAIRQQPSAQPAPCPAPAATRAAGAASRPAPTLQTHIAIAGVHALAEPSGAMVLEDERILIVADLHFEKGSRFSRGAACCCPPYDTACLPWARLAAVVARHAPRLVIALGDSFHDPRAAARLRPADRDALLALQHGRQWVWIAGNHDPVAPAGLGGEAADTMRIGALVCRHEPQPGQQWGEIAGHLHPAALVAGRSGTVRRRGFVSDGARCVLPAFGAYAGGLNLHDAAFAALFAPGSRIVHALGRDRVYAVHESRCLPEARSPLRLAG